jgi:aryl-alcohol dehydrogenase-like predicted oxidoreductase
MRRKVALVTRWPCGTAFAFFSLTMNTRAIGSLQVSVVGLGCNNFGPRLDASRTAEVVHAALDAGVNFFDTADLYGEGRSEEYLGLALRGRRSDAVIATKFGHERSPFGTGARPEHIRAALEGSLKRLGTDYVDLYQVHQPDPDTPIADTLGALDDAVRAGKVREIGCSQVSVAQLRDAKAAVKPNAARFVSVQNEYSMIEREPERGVLAECEREHLAFLPFFPLASGLLTGKYRRGAPPPAGSRLGGQGKYAELLSPQNLDMVERLIAFAESRGHTILELAISWLLSHDVVASVISGATKPEQVRANAAAAGWQLSEGERSAVEKSLDAREIAG